MVVELPENYTPSENEEYMCEAHLAYFEKKLKDWKHELLSESSETLNHLKEESWNESDITDRASVETDATLELRTRDRYRKLINKIDAAIVRINEDEFGFCSVTGNPIGLRRLEARPIATMTVEAQEEHEANEIRFKEA